MVATSIWETDSALWPKAPRDLIFLAEAFQEVGKSLFDDWTGGEAPPIKTPLAASMRRTTQAPEPPSRRTAAPPPPSPDDLRRRAEAREAFELALANERVAADKMLKRRLLVAAWIADKARNEQVATFGVGIRGGGSPVRLSSAVWNRSDDWELFEGCEVKTYVPAFGTVWKAHLFLARSELDRLLHPVTTGVEKKAEAWLRAQFADRTTLAKARPAFEAEALAAFTGLSARGFERVWVRVGADFPERLKPGRKSAK